MGKLLRRATEEDTQMPDRSSYPGTPRWVKGLGIIVIVLVLLAGIILFTGVGGEHGPRRHIPSGDAGDTRLVTLIDYTPLIEHEGQQP